jgi:hypothetical protein
MYMSESEDISKASSAAPAKRKRTQLREKDLRKPLFDRLHHWRAETHSSHALRAVWPITWLCSDDNLELLSKTSPDNVKTIDNVCQLLEETEEWARIWGLQILRLITQYDEDNIATGSRTAKKSRTTSKT